MEQYKGNIAFSKRSQAFQKSGAVSPLSTILGVRPVSHFQGDERRKQAQTGYGTYSWSELIIVCAEI